MGSFSKALAAVSPERALRRAQAKAQLGIIEGTFGSSGGTRSADTAHNAASMFRRAMRAYFPWTTRDPDAEVMPERTLIVARSREAFRNQPIARSAVNTMLTSVIGGGLELHCRIDRDVIGFESDDEATAWERRTERLFRAWANSTDADARRKNTFYRLQNIAYKSAKHTGEIFALLPLIPRKNTICDLRVQLIEADRVSNPTGKIDGPILTAGTPTGSLWDGVETGTWGEPVAYHIETTPTGPTVSVNREWKRILAFGAKSGRRQVIHFYEEDRPGQRRGLPFLAPILEMLKQISRYSEAELMAAVISGMFTVFIKHSADQTDDLFAGLPPASGTCSVNPLTEGEEIGLGNGAIVDLQQGEDVEFANPGRPNQQFDPFMTAVMKQIGMGLNIPYEVLTKQFTSSYSASRAAILQAWEVFKIERAWFVSDFCQPVYEEWLAQMIATGAIDAPGYFDSTEIQRAYCGSNWYGPVAPSLDPVKEVTAAQLRIGAGLSTVAAETERIDGSDWETNFAQRQREQARAKDLGLEVPPTPGGQQPPTPPDQPNE